MGWLDFFNRKNIIVAPFVREYLHSFEKRSSMEKFVSETVFVVLDTETTGLNTSQDYILSYGSIQVKNFTVIVNTAKEFYLKQKKKEKEAVKIHEIVYTENALPLEDFARHFLKNIGNAVIVGHHIGFDLAMLEKACRPFGLKKLLNSSLDTFQLAVRLELGKNIDFQLIPAEDYSLDALCERYKIPLDDRHTAAGDAFLTAQLFLKLLKLAEKKGIRSYRELMG